MSHLLYKVPLNYHKVAVHATCWIIFCVYEILLAGIITKNFSPFIHYLLFYSINIILFYFHAHFLFNYTPSFKTNLWRVPLVVILEVGFYIFAYQLISYLLNKFLHNQPNMKFMNSLYIWGAGYRAVYFLLYSTGYYLLITYITKRENELKKILENEQLKNQVLKIEQDFLRAKINPHLLYNTLSFIKYAAKKRPLEADEAVNRLAAIMNFALDDNTETILLTKEIEQVENIIGLNQLRFNHTLNVELIINLDNLEVKLIPLILLTLVENVFKHGNLMDAENPALIKIECTADHLQIITRNLVIEKPIFESHNTGIKNIQLRLEQYYKGKYDFKFEKIDQTYYVDLKIDLS